MTNIEEALYHSLSPQRQAEIDTYRAEIDDFPNECPWCGRRITEDVSFCDDRCEELFLGADHLAVNMVNERTEPDDDFLRDVEMEMKE